MGIAYAGSTFEYDLKLLKDSTTENVDTYHLTIREQFGSETSFLTVVEKLRNVQLIADFNPSIKRYERLDYLSPMYDQELEVVTGKVIHETSVFHCGEQFEENRWARQCQLDVRLKDGQKHMTWKKEESECKYDPIDDQTSCTLITRGQFKDLEIGQTRVMRAGVLALKAKISAIQHFFRIWIYTLRLGKSQKKIHEIASAQSLEARLETLLKDGKNIVKKGQEFFRKDSAQM